MEKQNKAKWRKMIICLFFLVVVIGAGIFLYVSYTNDKVQEDQFKELERVEEQDDKQKPKKVRDNKDWIGWLKIPNTSISYPVMQRTGDSEYYLHRDFYGNYSFYGTPFLDSRCTWDSSNCIIYGHNINGGRMFGALHAYSDSSYYREHPDVLVRAKKEKREYHIVSVMETDIESPVYRFTDTGNWEEYQEQVEYLLGHSKYETDFGDELKTKCEETCSEKFFETVSFITLSTCRSWVGHDARMLVIAARYNENSSVDGKEQR